MVQLFIIFRLYDTTSKSYDNLIRHTTDWPHSRTIRICCKFLLIKFFLFTCRHILVICKLVKSNVALRGEFASCNTSFNCIFYLLILQGFDSFPQVVQFSFMVRVSLSTRVNMIWPRVIRLHLCPSALSAVDIILELIQPCQGIRETSAQLYMKDKLSRHVAYEDHNLNKLPR